QREFYSVGPLLAGSALNITVWSYVDQLNIAVLTDDRTVGDPHEVTDAMVHAFTEIRRAAGLPGEMTAVTTALAPAPAVGRPGPPRTRAGDRPVRGAPRP